VEEFEGEIEALEGHDGIVAWAFVADESVGCVDFVPRVVEVCFLKAGADLVAAFQWYVRILATENHEELAFYFFCPHKGVVVSALAERA